MKSLTAARKSIAPANKFQRYRQNRRDKGMKLLRIWVPDSTAPGFAAEAARQAALVRADPGEREVLDFIENAFEWPDEPTQA